MTFSLRRGLSSLSALLSISQAHLITKRDGLTPAANASLPTNWSYVGCYNDSVTTRTLAGGGYTDDNGMNGSSCAGYCASKNFVYAGTEYSKECYCGNLLGAPSSLQNDTQCSMACSGNSSEACGASNYISIYFANKDAPKGPQPNPGPPGWASYGCWQDGNPRTLSKTQSTPGGASNMSVALCTAACGNAGYELAGVEYAGECYCDHYLAGSAKNASIDDCNMACNGNSSEFCGAGNRLNLYATADTTPGPKPTSKTPQAPTNWISVGCYQDSVQSRALSYGANVAGGNQNMTNANCIAACTNAGYSVAGTEYSGECFCDNKIPSTAATDGRCSMTCNGNQNDVCGGPNGLTVYQFNGWYDQGCWSDNIGGRTFRYGQNVLGGYTNMTVENCMNSCQKAGYTLAGVEYSQECFCDNAPQAGGGPASDGSTQCNMACSGNNAQTCGGPNRLNVYAYKQKTYSASSSTTSTSNVASISPSSTVSTTSTASDGSTSTSTQTTPSPTPSSTVNQTTIAPFKYAGCYTDTSANGRSLQNQQADDPNMTVESCIKACSSQGYAIAGMQYASQCFCDHFVHNAPSLVDDSQCNMNCVGNPGEVCGAGGRNSVYVNGTLTNATSPGNLANPPDGWSYAACVEDNIQPANSRTFPWMMADSQTNSNTACITVCDKFGYTAAGTEYGVQCFCGDMSDVVAAGARTLSNSSCNMRCSNDTQGSNGGEICGGQNAISLYTQSTPQNSWSYASGDAAGAYEFLIGGVVIPLITAPARNGKVTYMEKFGTSENASSTGAYELDLAQLANFTGAWRPMHVKTDVFCSAGLTLPDRAGRQINVGGWSDPSTHGVRLYWPDGSPGIWGQNDWQENGDEVRLIEGRWYPSAMIMANGSILVAGGEEGSNGAPVPSLELLPSPSGEVLNAQYLEDTDPYNLYPFLAVMPSGNILIQYYNQAKLLDPISLQPVRDLPNAPGAVNNPGSGRTYPFAGAMMIMPQSPPYTSLTILICGGSGGGEGTALDNCISINPDNPASNWTLERMPSKRVMPCMTALPDGTYLILNGAHQGVAGFGLASDPNLNAVLYDPSQPIGHRMTVMSNTTIARLYHSEAVLLDDGRILVSGSDPEDQGKHPQEYRNEVFIPPYLMGNPARPSFNISSLDWSYASTNPLTILSPGSGGPFRISMLGAVSSTHGNSMGQRTFFLASSCDGSGSTCTVTAPPDANVCPPGWFQLFLLDGNNVPSTAIWVRVGGDPAGLGNWPESVDGFDVPGMGAVERLF